MNFHTQISVTAIGSECEVVASSEIVFSINGPPRSLTRAETEWFEAEPKKRYHGHSGLALANVNRVETGVNKWYCSGTIFDKSGFYHQPGFLQTILQQEGNVVSLDLDETRAKRMPGTYVAATDRSSSRNIYHWLIDSLIPILTMRDAGVEAPLLITVDGELTRWQLESLDLLREGQVHTLDYREPPILVERLYWRRMRELINISYIDIRRLRRAFSPTPRGPARRLYLKRSIAGPRWFSNSSDVEAALALLGFEIFAAENMNFSEQIEAFASAEIVIGAHGAGLTNIVFCRPGCAVIEIHPEDEIRTYFWIISEMAGLRYHFLRGTGSMNHSIGVDVDRLVILARAAIREL